MGDCPKCGVANPGAVDFCPNPQCGIYLGWASAAAPSRPAVTPFQELRAVLRPEVSRGRTPARHQVSVTNDGNTPVSAQLAFRDQDAELTFEPSDGAATLQPGTTMDFPVRINGPRRWFGRTERLPFFAVVTPTGPQPPITLHGIRRQTAVFPSWIPATALAIVPIAIALYTAWPGPTIPQVADHPQSAAERELRDAGYLVDGATPISDQGPAGLVVKTDPVAGSSLAKGNRVQVFVSTGPCNPVCRRAVPATKGRTEADARVLLGGAGFTVGRVVSGSSESPAGTVTDTIPAGLTEAPTDMAVAVFVSSGLLSSPGPLSPGPLGFPPHDPPAGSPVSQPPIILRPQTSAPRTPPPTPPPPAEKCSPTASADRSADGLTITSPGSGGRVGGSNEASGTANLTSSQRLWLLLCAPKVEPDVGGGVGGFYIESEGPVSVSGGAWKQDFGLETRYPGDYILYAVIVHVDQSPYEFVVHDKGGVPFGRQLPSNARYVHVNVTCCS